jgi:hypothetical protein
MSNNISINTDLGDCLVLAYGHWYREQNFVYETINIKDSNKSYVLLYVIEKPYNKFTPRKKGLLRLSGYSEYITVSTVLAHLPVQHGLSIAFNVDTYVGSSKPSVQYNEKGKNVTGRLWRALEKMNSTKMPWTEQTATAILISEGMDINTNHIYDRLRVHTPFLSGCYNIETSSLEKYRRILDMGK